MKKVLALMLALTIAAVSLFALGVTAFADEPSSTATEATEATEATQPEATEPSTNGQTPDDPDLTTTQAPATQAPTQAPATQAPATQPTAPTTAPLVTLAPDATNNINDPDENGTTVPAPVDTDIPNTGSGIVVPALALLALAGGAVIAVKTKKED